MSQSTLDMVREFHDETGVKTPVKPCVPDWSMDNMTVLLAAELELKNLSIWLRRKAAERGAPRCLQRMALEAEELGEKAGAMASNDLIGLLDAALDCRYVADGTVLECGLGLVFKRGMQLVHESNMSKRFPDGTFHRDDAGKVLKGPDYRPVNLRPLMGKP